MATRFNRHVTRLCHSCDAPMARQEDSCWQCGAAWETGASAPVVIPAPAPDPEPALAQR
jgi:hypothetical protein